MGFNQQFKPDESALSKLSFSHTNIRSLKSNLDDFRCHLLLELDFHFHVIAMSETRIYNDFWLISTQIFQIITSSLFQHPFRLEVIERTSNEAFQALWIELQFPKQSNIICGVIYRQHNSVDRFLDYFEEAVDRYSATGKPIWFFW